MTTMRIIQGSNVKTDVRRTWFGHRVYNRSDRLDISTMGITIFGLERLLTVNLFHIEVVYVTSYMTQYMYLKTFYFSNKVPKVFFL